MKIVIIKYNAGNIQSVAFALERLGITPIITNDPEEIQSADKIIFPGVGQAGTAMQYLKEHKLDQLIINLKQPFLGICLGMQLLCDHSEENNTKCLGIFNTNVRKFFPPLLKSKIPIQSGERGLGSGVERGLGLPAEASAKAGGDLKIPHIGWNLSIHNYFYFVHSYYVELCPETIATTNHGIKFTSIIQKNNFLGTQFHPEKSGIAGERFLKQFFK